MDHFDVGVIGCGAGGFTAAIRAADLGKKVCLIEENQIGGAAVMWGALASKTFWELAKDFAVARKTDRGYRISGITADYRAVKESVFQAVRERQRQMRRQIDAMAPQRNNGPGSIVFKSGTAAFVSEHELTIDAPKGLSETIEADYFIIATGSRPRKMAGIPVDQNRIFDSDGILSLNAFPTRLLIIGAGIVGCEYAAIFANFNQTKVYLIDAMERIIPYEDADVSDYVGQNLSDNGVTIFHSARVKHIDKRDADIRVTIDTAGGEYRDVRVDAVLVAIGREADVSDLRLDRINISVNEQGALPSDAHCRVRDHIYAVGDVTVHPDLVNIAEEEARYAVRHICGIGQGPLNYRNMSTVMFFYPAVAAVGLNEKMCRQQKIPYRVARYANELLPRAIAMRATNGFVKILVGERDNRILGMRAGGPQVSNTIMSITYLMDLEQDIDHILRSVHPHPTMAEGIQECLRLLLGESTFKVQTFPDLLKIRRWHPDLRTED